MLHSTGKQYPVYNDSEGVKLHQQKTVAEEEKEEGKKKYSFRCVQQNVTIADEQLICVYISLMKHTDNGSTNA